MKMENFKGVIPVFSVYLFWGIFPIYWKLFNGLNPFFVFGVRVVLSFVTAFIILLLAKRLNNLFIKKRYLVLMFFAGLSVGVNWSSYIYAVSINQVLEASLAYYIAPFLIIFLSVVVFREKKTLLEYISIVIMMIGLLYQIITLGRLPFIAIIMGGSCTVYSIIKKLTPYKGLEGTFVEVAAILIPAIFLAKYNMPTEPMNKSVMIALSFSGLVTIVPLWIYSKAVKAVSITTLGFMQFLVPIMLTSLSVFYFKETIPKEKIISLGFILIAVIIYCYSLIKKQQYKTN